MKIYSLQVAYNLGYDNPSAPYSIAQWGHVTAINAFRSGQLDYQNREPRADLYLAENYDRETFERLPK